MSHNFYKLIISLVYLRRYFEGYILHIIYLHLCTIHVSEKTIGLRKNRRPFKLDPK